MFSYFTSNQQTIFLASSVLLITSILLYRQERRRAALVTLLLGATGIGFFMALLDPFLNLWDEQYHALVAKNLVNNPLKPTLFPVPLLDYDYWNWTGNFIWLHKQPLFLWQIAGSLELFGNNEIAVRIPSIIQHSLTALMIYRIGMRTVSTDAGYYGALFFAVAYYPLELVAGKYPTDHNDLSFLFYLTGSLWSWFEYRSSNKRKWLILTGVFSGCAVLVKWLFGLLVYPVWAICLLAENGTNRLSMKTYYPVFRSLLISLSIFLPWQLFILNVYPSEALHEYRFTSAHLFQAVEEHRGDFRFHFDAAKKLYGSGDAIPLLLLAGLFLLLKKTKRQDRIAISSAILIIYGFYSLAETKMVSYTVVAVPFMLLGLGTLTEACLTYLGKLQRFGRWQHYVIPTLLTAICFLLINLPKIRNYHTDWKPTDNCNRTADERQMKLIGQLKATVPSDRCAVFNAAARLNGHIPVMFYTGMVAYDFIPDSMQIIKVKSQAYRICVVDKGNLPDYIENDGEILKLRFRD